MGHVAHHVRLHLLRNLLLQLELIELLPCTLGQHFLLEPGLQLEHLNHLGLFPLHHLEDLVAVFVERELRDQVDEGPRPVYAVAAVGVNQRKT